MALMGVVSAAYVNQAQLENAANAPPQLVLPSRPFPWKLGEL